MYVRVVARYKIVILCAAICEKAHPPDFGLARAYLVTAFQFDFIHVEDHYAQIWAFPRSHDDPRIGFSAVQPVVSNVHYGSIHW